jgi:hypothetical protein
MALFVLSLETDFMWFARVYVGAEVVRFEGVVCWASKRSALAAIRPSPGEERQLRQQGVERWKAVCRERVGLGRGIDFRFA